MWSHDPRADEGTPSDLQPSPSGGALTGQPKVCSDHDGAIIVFHKKKTDFVQVRRFSFDQWSLMIGVLVKLLTCSVQEVR